MNDGVTSAVGVELLLTVTVNAGPAPQVVMVEAQQWDGNTGFSSPYFTDASGWPVGTNNGTSASDVVEAYMPLDRLGITQNINLFIQSGTPGGPFDIVGPAPFMFGVPIPTLNQWMLILYIGLFLIVALWFLRHQRRSKSKGLLALFAVTMLFGATCNIILDGQIGDWTDPALANDPVNDAGEDAVDILAFFTCYDHQNLFVRFDVEELENQPPIPDDQAVTLLEDTPTVISLTAADLNGDQLLFSIDTGPSNGTTGAVTSTGLNSADVTYTPNADYFGPDTFTFLVDDQNGGTAIGTVTITVDPVNDVPSFTAGAPVSVSKDTGPQVINGWATAISAGPPNESGQNLTFLVNVTSNPGVFAVPPTIDGTTGDLSFTPDADNNGTASLEIQLMDDGGTANGGVDTSPIQMVDITIGAVNDAPTFTAGADQTHNEDDGAIVVNAWATAMSPGPPDEAGQMLTFNAMVTSDPGSVFAVAPAIDATTGDLTYTLAADAFGVATVDVTLMDDGGTANGGVDTSPPHTLTITVNAVNDAPSFTNAGNVNVFKGGSTETIPAWATALSLGPANESSQSFTGFTVMVTSDPDNVLGNLPTVDTVSGNLVFDTTADNNGTATISVTLMDDGGTANGGVDTSAAAVIDIIVGAVNDAPTFTAGADQTHNEDDGAIVVNAWATAMSPGPPDEAGQMLTFNAMVTSDPGSVFAVAPAIDANHRRSHLHPRGRCLWCHRRGCHPHGRWWHCQWRRGHITATHPHHHRECGQRCTQLHQRRQRQRFQRRFNRTIPAWATALSLGPANESSQSFTGFTVMVTSDPNNVLGNLPTVDTVSGNLVFDTTADNNGTATVSVTLMDDGGTANGGVDTSAAAVIDIIVGAVNDAPTFTAGADQTHNEDDGAIAVNAWATAMSPGPPDEAGQMLTFNAMVTSDPGSIFAVAPAIDATTGNLTYTLAADAFGVATVDVTLMDDGGTANGGVDTSPPHTLTITVNAVNDAPSFTNAGNVNVFKGGGTETVPTWASALSLGPANESGQSFTGFTVMVTSDPNNVLGNLPTVDTGTGNLVFDTTADNNGTATISVTLMDDGGTANGGVDTSAAAVIDIIVGAVNDAPTFTAGADQTHNEDDGAIVVNAWATAMSPGPPDEAGQMLTFSAMVTSNPGSIFAVAPAINATTGDLTYTLAADAFGVALVNVTLMDDGGTANGGVDTSPVHVLTITVNAVNDAPSFSNAGDITVVSGPATETTPAWATMLSLGPANESSQSFVGFNVMVTSDPNGVLGTTPSVNVGTGDLSFDTNMNTGMATISVTLMDDGGTANGGVDTSAAAVITITVNPPNAPPVANDDSFDAAVHTLLEVGVTTAPPGHEIAGSVLTSGTPDSDPDAGTMLIVTGTANLTPGAVLNMNADGTFTLLPPPNTTSGTVTFDYTISDQHPTLPMTDTATVTITLFDPVWYVKNDHPGPSHGTSENPFQTLAEAEAASSANHKIFVFTGDGTVTGHNAGITLQNGQSLLGERVDLVLNVNASMSTIVTGSGMAMSAPRIGNTMGDVVTLGDDNIVRGLILLPTASAGVAGMTAV